MKIQEAQEVESEVIEQLKQVARQNEESFRTRAEASRRSDPGLEIVQPATTDPGFWAAGYFSVSGHGVYADFEGKFTGNQGDFHINGQLYGLIFGASSGAAVLCVYNPLAEHFFDTDLLAVFAEDLIATTIQFFWNGLLVATLTGPSFGAIAGLGGMVRATKY